GLEAWRWALMLGAIGAAVVGALFLRLPESPRWLAAQGRAAASMLTLRRFEPSGGDFGEPAAGAIANAKLPTNARQQHSFWSVAGPQHRLRAVLLGAMYFLSPWATIGFPLLIGAVLVEKGFRVADSLLYVGVAMFGPSIGVLAGALFIDRLERRT